MKTFAKMIFAGLLMTGMAFTQTDTQKPCGPMPQCTKHCTTCTKTCKPGCCHGGAKCGDACKQMSCCRHA